ncbi:hypothetical protein MKQ68_02965 [Chitinophaga horti]|uniref:Uncharacterized protein n=1 Tax=Chitinophaga horti TaxID=2920382 RepID=A0ABY6J3U8_9BACT|nr:hypothetical protein [Chitinophaga horti]UYQ94051.1 hypothetical protein MKQ68_02965 [Chitinophaga horti]
MKRLISILLLFFYLPLSYGAGLQVVGGKIDVDIENTGSKEEKTGTEILTNEHHVQQQLKMVKKTQSQAAVNEVPRTHVAFVSTSNGCTPTSVILPQSPLYIWHCVFRL